jgi:dipeptidyl-peptidase 4
MKRFIFTCIIGFQVFVLQSFAQELKPVTLEDVARFGSFFPQSVEGFRSANDGDHYTLLTRTTGSGSAIVKYSYETGEVVSEITSTTQIQAATGTEVAMRSYSFSPDETKILIPTETERIYRHSSKSKYLIYDLNQKTLQTLDDDKQMLATFSPSGNQVAFVKNNNLFLKDLNSGSLMPITTDGVRNKIINGASDWVYEEEFGFDKAFFWSPDGRYIAFYRFDETDVPTFSMDVYGDELYPSQDVFKYPKAGEANAKVTIHIYDVQANEVKPVIINQPYEYIPRLKWTTDPEMLCVFVMNRHQNHLQLMLAASKTGKTQLLYEEKDRAYVDVDDDIVFLKDNSFIWTSERDGYNHLYHIDAKGRVKKQITTGKFDVTNFYGYNPENKTLYYQAAETNPYERHIYSVQLNGKNKRLLTPGPGTHNATFNTGFKYFVHTHSQAFLPPVTTLHMASGDQVRLLQENARLKNRLETYELGQKEFFDIKGATGEKLSAWMLKPADFDPNKQYPVLMFVYGGPGSQTVKDSYDSFNDFWFQHLTTLGYIVVSVDNRGTGARGRDFKKATYLQLGKIEHEDQIAAAKEIGQLPYIQANRIGIFGWSYGGYMSSLCLAMGNDVFKLAIAVAPVTNWRFYDSIYTERYMRTPQENASGYDDNSPVNHVEKIKGKLLLVHGTADDNVHVQNSMVMTNALINADVQFQQFMYPDKNHGIYGGNTRYHLYQMMTSFIVENL